MLLLLDLRVKTMAVNLDNKFWSLTNWKKRKTNRLKLENKIFIRKECNMQNK